MRACSPASHPLLPVQAALACTSPIILSSFWLSPLADLASFCLLLLVPYVRDAILESTNDLNGLVDIGYQTART